MAKFNSQLTTKTTNMAGGVSYERSDFKKEVASVVLTSMLNGDSYYESEKDRLKRIEEMVVENPKHAEFIAKAMVYTRTVGNLRSISHYLAVLLGETAKGTTFVRSAISKSLQRVDDMTEVLSLWDSRNQGKMLPNSVRRAMKDALEDGRWGEYNYKKYAQPRSKVKLKDIIKVVHPTPPLNDLNLFKRIIEDELKAIETAQTVNASMTDASGRAETYIKMIKEGKLGYMAMLKNITKILVNISDEDLDLVCDYITNEKAVHNSKLLPFRFYDAYEALQDEDLDRFDVKKVSKAIETAFGYSAKNLGFGENERIAILLDESGSMGASTKSPFGIGKILTAALLAGANKDNIVVWFWASEAKEIRNFTSAFDFIEKNQAGGGGTDVYAALSGLEQSKTKVDTLIILTDMQMYEVDKPSYFNEEKRFSQALDRYRSISPDVKTVFWNLAGYGKGTPISLNENNVFEVAGFSDKLLQVLSEMIRTGNKDYLINEIEKVNL
jgi:60 kDa SS-A/Ro ribonucleoprotein